MHVLSKVLSVIVDDRTRQNGNGRLSVQRLVRDKSIVHNMRWQIKYFHFSLWRE